VSKFTLRPYKHLIHCFILTCGSIRVLKKTHLCGSRSPDLSEREGWESEGAERQGNGNVRTKL